MKPDAKTPHLQFYPQEILKQTNGQEQENATSGPGNSGVPAHENVLELNGD